MGIVNYKNGLASFGMPLMGGGGMSVRASNAGKHYFVDKNTGNDGNSGKSPDRAFKTIQAALNKCEYDIGNYVFVGEGKYQEQISLTKRGVHLIGMGADRTWLAPAATMTAGDLVTPVVTIKPTYTGSTCSGVELSGFRISGGGGYAGVYVGDGVDGLANASFAYIHDNIIDGSNLEGTVGVAIRGGSYIRVENNYIVSWLTCCVAICGGATRTAFYNIIKHNWLSGGGCGISLEGVSNSNLLEENVITDDYSDALTTAIKVSGGVLVAGACSGTDNMASFNKVGSAGTEITLGASDWMAVNYLARAGNASLFVTES